jgi:hypothetical protein
MTYRLLSILALGLAASPAWATLGVPQQLCQKTAATQSRVLFKSVAKALASCHDKIAVGSLPPSTDCTAEPGTAAKITKARGKLTTKIPTACPDPVVQSLPFGGDCFGVTTAVALGTCLADTHEDEALAVAAAAYGTAGVLSSIKGLCQKTTAKESVKFGQKRLGVLQKCRNNVGKGTLPGNTNCLTEAKTAARIAKLESVALMAGPWLTIVVFKRT